VKNHDYSAKSKLTCLELLISSSYKWGKSL